MDSKPHTHQARLGRELVAMPWSYVWNLLRGGGMYMTTLTYGDTTVTVSHRENPSRKELERALAKAITKHDKGSIKAGEKQAMRDAAQAVLDEFNNQRVMPVKRTLGGIEYMDSTPKHTWGSDLIAEAVAKSDQKRVIGKD